MTEIIKEYRENYVKGYIPRWALPRENIPVHIEWQNDINYDEIRIRKPDDFNFIDFLNVECVKISGNLAIINRVIKSSLINTITYFGFSICSTGIYDELKVAKTISIEFLQKRYHYGIVESFCQNF